jgi:hypothetical protein
MIKGSQADEQGICCKNSLTTQDVVAPASSSQLWNVTKIFFATDPKAAYMAKGGQVI